MMRALGVHMSPSARVDRRRVARGLLLAVPLAFLGVFFVYPVASIIGRGLTPGGTLDLSPLGAVVTDPHLLNRNLELMPCTHDMSRTGL